MKDALVKLVMITIGAPLLMCLMFVMLALEYCIPIAILAAVLHWCGVF